MRLFTPAWMTDDVKKQDAAAQSVRRIGNQQKLYKIATTAPLHGVRLAAVQSMTDQDMLFNLAATSSSMTVREHAIRNLTDQDKLRRIAVSATGDFDGLHAVQQISDPAALREVAMTASKDIVCYNALDKIADEKTLLDIAASAPKPEVRAYAVRRIKNQQTLLAFLMGDDARLQEAAAKVFKDLTLMEQITDQRKLFLIAAKTSDEAVRDAAFAAITDQNVLFDAAMDARYKFSEREAAAAHLTDPALLKRIALECDEMYAYNAALSRITDDATLAEIALSPKGGNMSAMKRINDTDALLTILENASDPSVRRQVRERLYFNYVGTDKQPLTESQFNRYVDDLIASPEAEMLPLDKLSEDTLRRAYREGANDVLRAKALAYLAVRGYIPADHLLDAWREARANSIAAGITGRHWRETQDSIAVAVANHAPEQLPDFIRNTDFNTAFECIFFLFKTKADDNSEGRAAARDSAAKAYLDCAMQESTDWLNGNSQEHCMNRFITFVPEDRLKEYGFEIGERYTNGTKYTYEGQVYYVE